MKWNVLEILLNPVFIPAVFGWFFAQIIKLVLHLIKYKRINWTRLMGSGGMPSSHTSFMMALSISVGLHEGFASVPFGIAFAITTVVMTDASGVRQAAGNHARMLNIMVEKLFQEGELDFVRLKELIGHRPIEVLAGAILGIAVAVGYQWIVFG